MLQGLRTLIFRINPSDIKKATEWYTELLKKPPYFEEPFYVGFNVGGFELGLDPGEKKISLGNNIETYWGVSDIKEALSACLAVGAKINTDIRDVGGEIKVATIQDPFGNVFGLIQNPHFKIEN